MDTKDKFLKERTVLFIGASPELEEELESIKKHQEKFFIISSDTSARFILNFGIKPDLILSIDSGLGTSYHLQDLDPNIPILTCLHSSRRVFELENRKLIYLTQFPLDQILNAYFLKSITPILNPSLNVAGLALSFAELMGAKKFLVSGISFGSRFGQTHVHGTGYEAYHLPKISRKKTLEMTQSKIYLGKLSKKNSDSLKSIFSSQLIQYFRETDLNQYSSDKKVLWTKLKGSFSVESFQDTLIRKNYIIEIAKILSIEDSFCTKILRIKKSP
ncbi:MAG: 6-hydroxymethylpterin diphosphokinase MptE-like protein [Leptospiraceae bacterium]|nr:6-hydroxymethylpterin diphosphokinase MptE-like protein [Leptospiraceae bacterium]